MHTHIYIYNVYIGFPRWLSGKNLPASAGNAGDAEGIHSIPGSGRSPRVGNGNPLFSSCLENCMDRGACWPMAVWSQRIGHD